MKQPSDVTLMPQHHTTENKVSRRTAKAQRKVDKELSHKIAIM